MNKTLIIARREYTAMVRTKAFMITTFLMPVLMFGAMFVQTRLRKHVNIDDRKIAVIDPSGTLFDELATLATERNDQWIFDKDGNQIESKYMLERFSGPVDDTARLTLSQRVRDKELEAFVEIPPDVLDNGEGQVQLKYYTDRAVSRAIPRWLSRHIEQLSSQQRLESAGVDPKMVSRAMRGVSLEELTLVEQDDTGTIIDGRAASREANILIPIMVMMLMFMSIMITAQPMLQAVVEEKQMRIAEVLLGSASPFVLMMGKLVGNVGVSLTLVAVYFGLGYFAADYLGYAELMPMHIVGWFVVYQVLAVMLFSSIFMAIGAACSDLKDAQSFLMPVMIILASPMFVWINVVRDPVSSFSTWTSLFPPATPMLMVLRLTVTDIPLWQPLLGIAVVLVSVVICVFAAGRIFRIGILSQGKTPRVNELVRWVLTG